uniref:ARAD1C08008p n=1 Tax=Blastobotrys adeninivorans TaxID=409370 RepID=A0A060T0H7_BLAAD
MTDIEQQRRSLSDDHHGVHIPHDQADKDLPAVVAHDSPPDLSASSIAHYFATRVSTLFAIHSTNLRTLNPIPALRLMRAHHWNWYFMGFMAWTIDSMDFFVVSSAATEIAASLNVTVTDITWGVTLVLMLRSVGAFIFGLMSDRYGRKWPYIICCFMFVVLEIGFGFVKTYKQFLGVRALFGIAMGGMYGAAAATALENVPAECRSVLSGLFLPGYNLGYIFAIIFYRAFQFSYKDGEGWRALAWFTAGPAFILMVWRLCFPEGEYFLRLKENRKEAKSLNIGVWQESKMAIKNYWLMFVYLIFLMSGFNFFSHGTQDLYPTLLVNQAGMSPDQKTVSMVVGNLGAICGGIFWGQASEILGRRKAIICCCIWAGIFVYPSFMRHSEAVIIPCSFFMQFGVMGSWGIAPIHLFELSPSTYRAFMSGFAYQLGNLASSASSTIEATLGARFPIEGAKKGTYDYGKVMAIFTACVILYMIIVIFLGPERFHRELQEFHTYSSEKLAEDEEIQNAETQIHVNKGEFQHRD